MTEYYLINAMKVRVEDPTAVCVAADTELAALKERYSDDFELQQFLMCRTDDAGTALRWLSSPIRLRYLFAGIEMQAETNDFTRADRVTTIPFEHDPLAAFWAQIDWQLNPPSPPSNTPTMSQIAVTEEPDIETYTVSLADGVGQALLFMCSLDRETRAPIENEPYCLCTDTQATHYGGVRECVLEGNTLHITLTRSAAQDLGIGPELAITLDVAKGSIDLLREGLRRVLACGPHRSRPKKLAL